MKHKFTLTRPAHLGHPHQEREWPNTDPTTGLVGPQCPICPQVHHVGALLEAQHQDPALVQHIEQQTAAAAQVPPWMREDPAQTADDNNDDDGPGQVARAAALDLYRERQGQEPRGPQEAAAVATAPRESAASSSAPAHEAEEMQSGKLACQDHSSLSVGAVRMAEELNL